MVRGVFAMAVLTWLAAGTLKAGCLSEYQNISLNDASLVLKETTDPQCLEEGVESVLYHTWSNGLGGSCMECELQIAQIILDNNAVTRTLVKQLSRSHNPLVKQAAQEELAQMPTPEEQRLARQEAKRQEMEAEKEAEKEAEEKAEEKAMEDRRLRAQARIEVPALKADIERMNQDYVSPGEIFACCTWIFDDRGFPY